MSVEMTSAVHVEEWDHRRRGRVVHGLGSGERLGELLAESGARTVLVVTDRGLRKAGLVDRVELNLQAQGLRAAVHDDTPPNPSTGSVDEAVRAARWVGADWVLGLGGGAALDTAKAVALLARSELSASEVPGSEPGEVLPIAAVPTTAGTGSETNGFGVFESVEHCKVYLGSDRTTPELVVLDAELTASLPPRVTAASGFDAVIHAAESLLSRGATTLSRTYASESIRLTTSALSTAVSEPDIEARSRMLLGAHLAGHALTLSGLGLVHGLGHSITATTGTPHGAALAAVAGPALRFGSETAPEQYRDLARALGVEPDGQEAGQRSVDMIVELAHECGLPTTPREVGVGSDQIETVVAKTLDDAVTRNSPRWPEVGELRELLTA